MNIRKIIKEEIQNINEWGFISDLMTLTEGEPNVFEWDIIKEKIDGTKEHVKTKGQAEKYLNTFMDKVKKVPKRLKIKMVKYVITGLVGFMGMGAITNVVNTTAPEIKDDVLMVKTTPMPNLASLNMTTKRSFTHAPSDVSSKLINFLKHEEGSIRHKGEPVLSVYMLDDGMVTVGWGHAERVSKSNFRKGQTIDKEKAEELLRSDIADAKGGLDRVLSDWKSEGVKYNITQGMYDSMVSLIFNMGIGGFRKSDLFKLVKGGKYEEAGKHIEHTHITYPGHVPRRKKESEMFVSV